MYSRFGAVFFVVQDQDTEGRSIATRPGPSVIAFAHPALVDALAVNATTVLARVHADAFDIHETGMAPALIRRHAFAVLAVSAARRASTFVCQHIPSRRFDVLPVMDVRLFEDVAVVALADIGSDARAVVTDRADGLASAPFRISVTVETCATIGRNACTVVAIEVADRLAFERNVPLVVINHTVTVLADAQTGRLADPVSFAGRVADGIAHVCGIRRRTVALTAVAHVGQHADTVLASGLANGFAEVRIIALARSVTGIAGALVRRAAVAVDAVGFADGFAESIAERTEALVASANLGCAAKAIDTAVLTDGFADVAA